MIRAHARSRSIQAQAIPLVIAGSYSPQDRAAFHTLAVDCGGDPDLVQVPGRIPDQALFGLYGQSLAMLCPSRDEGFSLPVVESMAAGVPSIVSDIPAHQELVTDPALRFPANDDTALTPLLERVAADADWCERIVASQAAVWPQFRADAVAARFWEPVLDRLAHGLKRPGINRGVRPRIAIVSPMPPEPSGVSDYTAATCVELGKLVDLDVFSGVADPPPVAGVQRMLSVGALPYLHSSYDRVVSVIGNSHFHLKAFKLMRRYGSACIAHDARMLGILPLSARS